MPTKLNDYTCLTCDKVFEYLSHGAEDEPACPFCNSANVSVKIGNPGLELINKNNHDFHVRQDARLSQRAAEHNNTKQVQDAVRFKTEEAVKKMKQKLGM